MDVKQPRRIGDTNPLSMPMTAPSAQPAKPEKKVKNKAKAKTSKVKRGKHTISLSADAWKRLQLNAMLEGVSASAIIERLILDNTENVSIRKRAA